jgi:hypothetical protein
MKNIDSFYQSFMQDIISTQLSSEEGGEPEQIFTQKAFDLLRENGNISAPVPAYDEKGTGTKSPHKINGYDIDDDGETLNLFISIYKNSDNKLSIQSDEINKAITRIENFIRKVIYKNYANKIEESSEIFQFAHYIATDETIQQNLQNGVLKINATILSNCEYTGRQTKIPSKDIGGCKIFYEVIDINSLYQIEVSGLPIEIDFDSIDNQSYRVPCLMANTNTPDYKAYISIIPGICLAKLYEQYTDRLLQQNVRSFLQIKGKNSVNVGIKDTIIKEPYMFLAYNNGITATADYIELDETKSFIKKIHNLQIVNGGQTTATIYHSWKNTTYKADISDVYVQMKLSVIDSKESFADIVSNISKFANTQNKVKTADFSSNNSCLKKFKELSDNILAPRNSGGLKTYWFFERVRGEYKNRREMLIGRSKLLNNFDLKNPKNQVITKGFLGLCLNSFPEVYEGGGKLVIGPHIVVRGEDRNFPFFIKDLPGNINQINNVYFEDAIAKCILFKTAQNRYGVAPKSIGRERQTVVPYTLALLNRITDGKINLYKIWKNQALSQSLSDFIYGLMKQVNKFIWDKSPSTNYNEEGKKERMWLLVRDNIQLVSCHN